MKKILQTLKLNYNFLNFYFFQLIPNVLFPHSLIPRE